MVFSQTGTVTKVLEGGTPRHHVRSILLLSCLCFFRRGLAFMQVHCLGTVGYHPNDSRHTSCYILPAQGVVLDGTGVFRLAQAVATDEIDLLLSHAHLDHTFGLTNLLDVQFERPGLKKLRIWGESEKLAAVREHLFHELIFPAPLDAEWCEIDGKQEFAIGNAKVSWRAQDHPGGSVAYRLDWPDGKRLVYATDTTGDTSPEHADWSRDADLLMHECYFRDEAQQWARFLDERLSDEPSDSDRDAS